MQFDILASLGVEIIYYEDEFPLAKRQDNIKFVSDEVRLMALSKYGGTYMDMDIGPGEETFETDLYHRREMELPDGRVGYLPLLGSVFPFSEAKPSLEQEEAAYANGYRWNYFFSSQKGNPVIAEMLKRMQKGEDGQQILEMLNVDGLFKHAYVPWDLEFSTSGSRDKKESGDKTGTENLFTFNGHEYFYDFDFTPSDGNCFFHAVLQALEQAKGIKDITPQQLRRSAFRHSNVPVPHTYERNGIWVDDRMAAGVVAFLHTRGVNVTIQVHYLMADGSHFYTVTYENGPDVLDIVMKDNFAHFTHANQL